MIRTRISDLFTSVKFNSSQRLLGRWSQGKGYGEEISLGAGLTLENGVMNVIGDGGGGPPTGGAGGVLSGTYPNPGFAVNMATQAELDDAKDRANHTGTQPVSSLSDPENLPVSTAQAAAILAGDTAILRTYAQGDPNIPQSMTITGTLTDGTDPVVFPVLVFTGVSPIDGKPFYETISGGVQYEALYEGEWVLSLDGLSYYVSDSDVASPSLADWSDSAVSPATGTPVVTAGPILQGQQIGQLLRLETADPDDGVYRWFVWTGSSWNELTLA